MSRLALCLGILLMLLAILFLDVVAPEYVISATTVALPRSVAWNFDSSLIAYGYNDGNIQIVDVLSGNAINSFRYEGGSILSIAWRPDNRRVAFSAHSAIIIWDTDPQCFDEPLIIPINEADPIFPIAWTHDGSKVIGGSLGFSSAPTLRIWDAVSGEILYSKRETSVYTIVSHPNQPTFAEAGYSNHMRIRNDSKLEQVATFSNMSSIADMPVYSMAWDRTGTNLAVGFQNGKIGILHFQAGAQPTLSLLATFVGNNSNSDDYNVSSIRALTFGIDGTRLSSLSANGTLRTWDLVTQKLIMDSSLEQTIYAAAFSPDGTSLAIGGEDGSFHLIDAP